MRRRRASAPAERAGDGALPPVEAAVALLIPHIRAERRRLLLRESARGTTSLSDDGALPPVRNLRGQEGTGRVRV